ncbi:MAG: phage tail tape measure protein [Bradyrhizobium sp.]
MADALNVALRISAIDAFGGVLNRLRRGIGGLGAGARAAQADYDKMFRHLAKGFAGLAVAKYGLDKLDHGVAASADLQESLLSVKQILQGAHPQAARLADQMARVRYNSIEVASGLKYSATEITDVTRNLIKSGVPMAAILDKLDKRGRVAKRGLAFYVEALAETQGMTPAETAAQIGNIGHAFRLKPNEYAKAINLIAQAGPTASGSLTELFHNLQTAGAVTKYAGNTDLLTALAALKTVAPLGEEGGSDLAMLLERISGMSVRGSKRLAKSGISFYEGGQFIGLTKSIEKLQKIMSKLTPEQRNKAFGPILGAQGLKALALLSAAPAPGVKSFQEIKKSIGEQASLSQQVKVWEQGLNAQLSILHTTNKTTLATLFNPALSPITAIVRNAAEFSGKIGTAAETHKAIARGVSIGGAAIVGGAGLYGLYHFARAIGPGKRVLGALGKRMFGTAGGIAEGKAVQAATGVTPVFVTNWSQAPMGGASGTATGALAASSRRGVIASLRSTTLASFRLRNGLKGVTAAAGKTVLGLGAAAAAGWAVGTVIEKQLVGTKAGDFIGHMLAWDLAHLGNKEAQQALKQNEAVKTALRKTYEIHLTHHAMENVLAQWQHDHPHEVNVKISVDTHGKVTVSKLSTSHPSVHAEVGHASSMP